MNQIYPSTFCTNPDSDFLDSASDLFKYCAAGDIVGVKSLLNQNENIYREIGLSNYRAGNVVPMFVAFSSKNLKLVNELLDIYERDLEALSGLNFKSALIALPEDQTEEFMSIVETEVSDDVIPVLLKVNNNVVPKCVFLRRKLKERSDKSLQLAEKLKKNGRCDLNWQIDLNGLEDSFLHLAIHLGLNSVINRLLSHPTVNPQVKNSSSHTPLHWALHKGNLDIVNLLLSTHDCEKYYDDPSYLYQAALSGKQRAVEFMINEILKSGKSMQDILEIPFSRGDCYEGATLDYLLHVLVQNGSNLEFSIQSQLKLNEQDFYKQNSNGETILHQLVLSPFEKLKPTIKLITDIAKKYPKLLLIKNKNHQLPLHYAAFYCTLGQRLYKHLWNLTVQESGNPDIFFDDPEAAVTTLEKAITINSFLSAEYLKNFERLLVTHGTRLLHKVIQSDRKLKTLKGILSSSIKINPNEFYEGKNAFLLLNYDIDRSFRSICGQEIRLRMLDDYHPIKDPNERDDTGTSLFMYIVSYCENNDFVRSLINAGADCLAKNSEGLTCLHFAASNSKNKEIVQLMLDNGADPTALSFSNKLAIHFAIFHENLENVKVLLPLMSNDDLKSKLGKLNETLIHLSMRLYRLDVLKTIWDYYEIKGIEIEVNSTNDDGDNLPMIALGSSNVQHLDLLFSKYFNEIDFNHKNTEGETFVHKITSFQQVVTVWKNKSFDTYPKLHQIINDQMNLKNIQGDTPMDNLSFQCQFQTNPEDDIFQFFVQQITFENLQENFHKFFRSPLMIQTITTRFPDILDNLKMETAYRIFESALCNFSSYVFLFKNLSIMFADVHSSRNRNVLHLVCESNDIKIIDATLKKMSEEVFEKLKKEQDVDGKTPVQFLNDENQEILAKCFT